MSGKYNSDTVNELLAFYKGRNEGVTQIGQSTLTGSVTSVTFDLTDYQQFRTLFFVGNIRTDRASTQDGVLIRFNADSGNNYDYSYYGVINATFSGGNLLAQTRGVFGIAEAANSLANAFSTTIGWFPNYSSAVIQKFIQSHMTAMGTPAAATMTSFTYNNRWRSTAAITSILLYPANGPNFVSGSIFSLYGVY